MDFKGKTVPYIMNVKKWFEQRKAEREIIRQMPETLKEMRMLLNDVKSHYSDDNITMRDKWIENVDRKEKKYDQFILDINDKMDKMNDSFNSMRADNMRNWIIDFASRVTEEKRSYAREEFTRALKIYSEYEDFIHANDMTNGEVDIAHRIIVEAYEENLKNHTFIEDIRGYGI